GETHRTHRAGRPCGRPARVAALSDWAWMPGVIARSLTAVGLALAVVTPAAAAAAAPGSQTETVVASRAPDARLVRESIMRVLRPAARFGRCASNRMRQPGVPALPRST